MVYTAQSEVIIRYYKKVRSAKQWTAQRIMPCLSRMAPPIERSGGDEEPAGIVEGRTPVDDRDEELKDFYDG